MYARWFCDENWDKMRKTFFSSLPAPYSWFVPTVARKKIKETLVGQGMGRHSKEEVLHITDMSLNSLSLMLGDKDYFMGEQPCSLDAVAYGFLVQFIVADIQDEFCNCARGYENLVAFCDRVEAKYF
jgi:hypothetical protein